MTGLSVPLASKAEFASAPPDTSYFVTTRSGTVGLLRTDRLLGGIMLPSASGNASTNVSNFYDAITKARKSGHAQRLIIPPETYTLDDVVDFHNMLGLVVQGCGLASKLEWTGDDATQPMLRVSHCTQCRFEDFQLILSSEAYTPLQLRKDNLGAHENTQTRDVFQNLFIQCAEFADYGVLLGGTGAIDQNNDFHKFQDVYVTSYREAGYEIAGTQAYGIRMLDCTCNASGGNYGVNAYRVSGGGSFGWYGGSMVGNQGADFRCGNNDQPFVIEGHYSELSARLLEGPEVYRRRFISIRDTRASGEAIHADTQFIKTTGQINMEITNCEFGNEPNDPLTLGFHSKTARSSITMTRVGIIGSSDPVFIDEDADEFLDSTGIVRGNFRVSDIDPYTEVPLLA